MTIKVVVPDDFPCIHIRSYKLMDGYKNCIEDMHTFDGIIYKDWATIDLTRTDTSLWQKQPGWKG